MDIFFIVMAKSCDKLFPSSVLFTLLSSHILLLSCSFDRKINLSIKQGRKCKYSIKIAVCSIF